MIRLKSSFSVVALVLGLASVGLAAPPASAEAKIGYVDLQRALNEVEEGASAKAKLKKEFDAKQRTLDNKQNELKGMKDELDARGMMMTPEAKQEKLADLQKKLMEVQQLYMQLQQELSQKEAEVTSGIFTKMGTILQTMGREQNMDLIVEKSAVLYAKNHMDVTNELIRRYNKSYGSKKKSKTGK
jgi:outer membrane protein